MLALTQQDVAPLITLRPYQETCVERVIDAYQHMPMGGRALLVLPTGGGKTLVFAEIARRLGLNTLIIAHRQELLQQAADKFRMIDPTAIIGQVGAGRHEWGAPITVASVQTISRPEHLKTLKRFGYQLVIIDECFPAGTLIDGKPIEQIKVGDIVTAFNEQTQTFSRKRVVRTFCRPANQRLLRIHAGAAVVVCTPNHPFYTAAGWKAAEDLTSDEEILYVGDNCAVCAVPRTLPPHDEASANPVQSGKAGLLFRRMQARTACQGFFPNNGANQQEVCFSAYDRQQSNAQGGEQTQNASHLTGKRPCTDDTWRQWKRSNTPTEASCRGVGLANGICGQNTPAQDQPDACPDQLQAGYCQPGTFDRDRSRWHVACGIQSSVAGSEERTGARWVRVDHSAVYEPGRDGTCAGMCPDGLVYNFEVEEDHTYLANGFVVHNCHHSTASGYRAVLDMVPDAFVLGVTATPDRLDKQSIEHIFGAPIFSASIIDMIEQGYLCNLRAIAIPTTTSLDGLHTHEGDFKLDELEVAIDTPDRNERIVSAYLKHCNGRQGLCFAVTVAHAQHLAEAFQDADVRCCVVSGETPLLERQRSLLAYERGSIQVVCNVGVLTEGYDAVQTSCIIMARPTKSRALYTQAIGRGTRLAPGKTDCIILDITDNSLKLRLEPLTLSKVVEMQLGDGESVVEAKAREKRERELSEEPAEARERTTRVTRRVQEMEINLLNRFDWKRKPNGGYFLEVGENKHKVILLPPESVTGYYSVWAKLAPDFKMQQWLPDAPLEWAQTHAEMKAKLIQSSEKKLILVDNNAPWRSFPVSNKQLYMLRKFDIPFTEAMTSGEASDLIGREIAKREKEKAEKAAQKGVKQGRKRGRASA